MGQGHESLFGRFAGTSGTQLAERAGTNVASARVWHLVRLGQALHQVVSDDGQPEAQATGARKAAAWRG